MKYLPRSFALCLAILFSMFLAMHSAEARFRKGPIKPPPAPVYTAIASVDPTGMTITTESKNTSSTATKTYRISPRVKITVNGQPGTIADLKPGLQISVGAGMDAGVAEELSARTPPADPAGTRDGHHKR